MKKVLVAIAIVFASALTVNAQTYTRLTQAAAGDTTRQSQTVYTPSVNLNTQKLQALVVSVKTTTVTGTPDVIYVLQRSEDGVNWYSVAGDTMTYSATVVKKVIADPFYSPFVRVKRSTGAGAQLTKNAITIKTWNK